MKETSFIAKNQEKWLRFEKNKKKIQSDPEELCDLYSEISNDLSYAKTFYEKRTVRSYLNGLAQGIHSKLYKQKKEPFKKVINAWTIHLPLEIYKARKNIFFAFALFLFWVTVGVVSSYFDPYFAKLILGEGYIAMTEQNILEGNPLGVYGNESQTSMFFSITLNNIGVALKCFFAGVLFSIGTHIILFQNAIMLGAFQYFFKLKGLLLTSFLTIWIHGAFEISAIVIASGAGFTVGHGLLFPGSHSRLQSFQMNAIRGIRILLSLIPIFIIAGALESFVTRNYLTLPDWSKALIILLSFATVIFYYVIYPIIVARRHPELLNQRQLPNYLPKMTFNLNKIRSVVEVVSDTFQFYRSFFSKIFRVVFTIAFPLVIIILVIQFFHHFGLLFEEHFFDWAGQLSLLFGNPYTNMYDAPIDLFISFFWLFPILIIASAVFYAFNSLNDFFSWKKYFSFLGQNFGKLFISLGFLYALFIVLPYQLLIPFSLLLPFFYLWAASASLSSQGVSKGFKYGLKNWGKTFGVILFFSITIFLLLQPIAFVFSISDNGEPMMNDLLDLTCNFIKQFLLEETQYFGVISNVFRQLVYVLALLFILPLLFISSGFLFYSTREETEVIGLKKNFENFGKQLKTQETNFDYED